MDGSIEIIDRYDRFIVGYEIKYLREEQVRLISN
jgi:hypothetical protein